MDSEKTPPLHDAKTVLAKDEEEVDNVSPSPRINLEDDH